MRACTHGHHLIWTTSLCQCCRHCCLDLLFCLWTGFAWRSATNLSISLSISDSHESAKGISCSVLCLLRVLGPLYLHRRVESESGGGGWPSAIMVCFFDSFHYTWHQVISILRRSACKLNSVVYNDILGSSSSRDHVVMVLGSYSLIFIQNTPTTFQTK